MITHLMKKEEEPSFTRHLECFVHTDTQCAFSSSFSLFIWICPSEKEREREREEKRIQRGREVIKVRIDVGVSSSFSGISAEAV